MTSRDPWTDGEQAWSDLIGWARYRERGDALAALNSIGQLRRLLDETEFAAVRAARQQGKSWAEIAVKLGVTRQSAWERWREVDTEQGAPQESSEGRALARAAHAARHEATVVVPMVIDQTVEDARVALAERALVGVSADQDDMPIAELILGGSVVTDQSPQAGTRVAPGATVRLWTRNRGGGAGVREPRRPRPTPQVGLKAHEVPHEEVG
jgi:transposase-like protein